jgi:hypothetical protein
MNETERSLTEFLMEACEENERGSAQSFEEAGVMTTNQGFELRSPDGRTFQVTVVEGRRWKARD